MKRFHVFAVLALAVVLAVPARAQTTPFYDQQYTASSDQAVSETAGSSVAQSFTPTASAMNAASFYLGGFGSSDPGASATCYVQILSGAGLGGSVLGQSGDVVVPAPLGTSGTTAEVPFQFPATVALTSGNQYTLVLVVRSVTDPSVEVSVAGTVEDGYAGGQAYNGPGIADFDFREGLGYPASVTTVHSFSGSDGQDPEAALIQANDGNLYGTTLEGDSNNGGTVFMMSTDGTTFTTLHAFNAGSDGSTPAAGLLQANDGGLYGTANAGGVSGDGTVFRSATDGTGYRTSHSFTGPDGQYPEAGLIQASDGNLYGTILEGGANGVGAVFMMSPDGTTYQILHSFSGTDGQYPEAALIQANDGNLYGTTEDGGANNDGTVFMVSLDGTTYRTVHSFNGGDGKSPEAGVIQASDGNLYGTTHGSGANSDGTVFMVSLDGTTFNTLHSFSGGDGQYPLAGLIQASDGNLYGTTANGGANNDGTVFMVSTDGTTFATLYGFGSASNDGVIPEAGLLQASDGNLYGTTVFGGTQDDGEVFQAAVSLPDVVQFHQTINSVNETAGNATVRVDRVGDDGSVLLTASYMTSDGTAQAGTDYTATTGELTWNQGDLTPKFITVPITNRGFTDGSLRTLSINLSDVIPGGGSGTSLGYPSTVTLTINGSIPGAPIITSPRTATATQGKAFAYRIAAGAKPTSFAASNLPAGLQVTAAGLISGTPTVPGPYSVGLSATNARGTGTATLSLSVAGAPPAITSPGTATAATIAAFSYQIAATNSPTSFAATGLPTGLTVDTTSGQITGSPHNPGTSAVTISATNGSGTGSERLTITINAPPVITSATSVSAKQASALTYQITATNSPTSYAASGLPKGLTLNATTGQITGTPVDSGTAVSTVSATNATGTGTGRVTFTISAGPPVITSNATASATVGQAFSYQISARNTPTSYAASGLPTGLAVNTSTGAITGKPVNAGKAAVPLSATNAAGSGTAKLTITIAAH